MDIIFASQHIRNISKLSYNILVKFINTGMKAPDGFYYQQGNPDNLIINKDNYTLIKYKEIKFYRKDWPYGRKTSK